MRAAAGGVVVEAGWMGAYGYGVVIDHGHGVQTRAQHGAAPGLRVRINGRLVNPLGYVRRP